MSNASEISTLLLLFSIPVGRGMCHAEITVLTILPVLTGILCASSSRLEVVALRSKAAMKVYAHMTQVMSYEVCHFRISLSPFNRLNFVFL